MALRPGTPSLLVLAAFASATACSNTPQGQHEVEDASAPEAALDSTVSERPKDAERPEASGDEPAAPTLTELTIIANPGLDGSAGTPLTPPFAPGTHDYYVPCVAGTNVLMVSMVASPGAVASLSEPIVTTQMSTESLLVGVVEGKALVALATQGSASTAYWVRCLPHDFPALAFALHPEAGAPTPGYYLVGDVVAASSGGYAMVLDGNGVPVWYATMGPGLGALDVDSVVAGSISFVRSSSFLDENFEIVGLSPQTAKQIAATGYVTNPHELRVLPNGHFLLLSYPQRSGVDLTGLNLVVADGGAVPLGPGSTIQDCVVVEFEASGNVVSTWRASDHFDPAKVSEFPVTGAGPTGALPDGGTVYDVFHCNSIDVDPQSGDMLVSARQMNSVFYVDRASGKVLWKMGGADASLDDAPYVSVADPFHFQHDARLLPGWSSKCGGGAGQVSMFDDESLYPTPARGVVYDVFVGADGGGQSDCDAGLVPDGGAGKATVAWQFKGSATSLAMGSFRISADGSRVIGWGIGNAVGVGFTEVDVAGHDLLDFGFPDDDVTYRAIKVPLGTFDLDALRNAAGK